MRSQDFEHSKAPDLLQALTRSLPFTSLENQAGNPYQQDFNYRGFVASPVPGTPQGIAVYQNGVRINEAYGDVVNWAFLPEVAINKLTLQPNNPVFGLNAIGGAVSIDMKNGFNYHGTQVDGLGGMYGRLTGSVQSGVQNGGLSIYAAADATNDRGWRDHSSSSYLRRMYTDLGAKGEQAEFHLMFTGADNMLGAVAATPLQLLNQRWSSVYTWPQTTHQQLAFGQATGAWAPTDSLSFQGVGYYRALWQGHVDGNSTDAQPCDPDPDGPLAGQLCIGDGATAINQSVATPNSLSPDAFLGEITNPLLTSNNHYDRLNPVIGATYKFGPALTAYAGYWRRTAPRPRSSLGAPIRSPMIDNFLISDPALQQVVSHL